MAAGARQKPRQPHRRRRRHPRPTLGQGGTIAEQVAALQSGSRGKPGYNPNPNPPGATGGRGMGIPRKPEEIRRGVSAFSSTSCEVKSDGGSLAVTFPGMKLGIFDGNLRFTVYRGTNLIQMDAIARTNEPWVAYKYDAGLKGFSTATMPRVTWRDTGGHPQQHQFGGPKSNGLAGVRAANRLLLAEGPRGSVATFPPPHTFFFTREVDVNLGYVFYRNDGGGTYSIGVTMPEAESDTFPNYAQNYALYNAPPGTWQKMSMYFYASPETGRSDAAGRAGVYARRRLQAGSGLQDVRQSLPPRLHGPSARRRDSTRRSRI